MRPFRITRISPVNSRLLAPHKPANPLFFQSLLAWTTIHGDSGYLSPTRLRTSGDGFADVILEKQFVLFTLRFVFSLPSLLSKPHANSPIMMASRQMCVGLQRIAQQDQANTCNERDDKERLQELMRG